FTVEHPIFTSRDEQDWDCDENRNRLHWPVDHYQDERVRQTEFLDEQVMKYHRTLSTYINDLIDSGFVIRRIEESFPSEEMLHRISDMRDEMRRPMFLMIESEKGNC